jgi:hypothetical protein
MTNFVILTTYIDHTSIKHNGDSLPEKIALLEFIGSQSRLILKNFLQTWDRHYVCKSECNKHTIYKNVAYPNTCGAAFRCFNYVQKKPYRKNSVLLKTICVLYFPSELLLPKKVSFSRKKNFPVTL